MPHAPIHEFVGVYDADGSVLGELRYFVRAHTGRAHCALCDITHGLVRERADWRDCRDALGVPFRTFHRDDQPDEVRAATGGLAPVVVAATDDGFVVLLGPPELGVCDGSPDRLVEAVRVAAADRGLVLPI